MFRLEKNCIMLQPVSQQRHLGELKNTGEHICLTDWLRFASQAQTNMNETEMSGRAQPWDVPGNEPNAQVKASVLWCRLDFPLKYIIPDAPFWRSVIVCLWFFFTWQPRHRGQRSRARYIPQSKKISHTMGRRKDIFSVSSE